MIKLVISGCRGRMGSRITALANQDKDIDVAGTFDLGDNPEEIIRKGDVLVEFTTPEATLKNLEICLKHKKAIVIGTTAIDEKGTGRIKEAAKKIAVVFSPNMSVGVNVLFGLAKKTGSLLSDYNISIREAHHKHKKDAPSGTAKRLVQIIKEASGKADIPVESVREGEIVGDHTVFFDGEYETLKLRHRAKSRDVFASGAICAAKFIAGKKKGLFSMQDVLGV